MSRVCTITAASVRSVMRGVSILGMLCVAGCATQKMAVVAIIEPEVRPAVVKPLFLTKVEVDAPRVGQQVVEIETTAYCSCSACCGWQPTDAGPVFASGRNVGKPKVIGVTASGSRARKGTIAADVAFYPFGTKMIIPGYGIGHVEDVGGAIKGPARIDLFFESHEEALAWGRTKKKVHILQ